MGGWWWWWASGVRNLPCSHIPCHLEETPPTPPPPLHRHNPDAGLDVAAADQVERRGSVCVSVEREVVELGVSIQLHHLSLVNGPRFSFQTCKCGQPPLVSADAEGLGAARGAGVALGRCCSWPRLKGPLGARRDVLRGRKGCINRSGITLPTLSTGPRDPRQWIHCGVGSQRTESKRCQDPVH